MEYSLGCGITFLIIQLIESYWLSPKVMGDRTGLHPVVIIASVFFWGTAPEWNTGNDSGNSPYRIPDRFLEASSNEIFCFRIGIIIPDLLHHSSILSLVL